MTEESDKGWIVFPLEDRKVNELVLPRRNIRSLRRISKEHNELTGILHGVTRDKALYFMGYLILGEGSPTQCEFDEQYREFYNDLIARSREVQPTLTTILYHNHPRVASDEYPDETLRILQEDIDLGVFDYLWDYGVKPTIDSAIAEHTRSLSPADVDATFGRAHILISDTAREGDDFSHINAYKFDPDSILGVERFKVSALSDKQHEIHAWAGGVCSSLKKVYEEVRREREKQYNY